MIEISVYLNTVDYASGKRKLCERVNVDSISLPYDDLRKVFRFLYGSGIVFTTVEML